MWPYIILLALISLSVVSHWPRYIHRDKRSIKTSPLGLPLICIIFIGLRYQTGGDWDSYIAKIEQARSLDFSTAMQLAEPGYAILNWISAKLFGTIYFVNITCSFILIFGLTRLGHFFQNPYLAYLVSFPYVMVVLGMGYTRQGAAIGLIMIGLVALSKGNSRSYIALVALASSFHLTAIFMAFFAILQNTKNRIQSALVTAATVAVVYFLLAYDSVEKYSQGYIEAEYQSSGALIRILMLTLSALIFLVQVNKFNFLAPSEKSIWKLLAYSALCLPLALYISPSSTAVDRLALYWYPLQVLALSALPGTFKDPLLRAIITLLIIVYTISAFSVWILFSPNSASWIPYKFIEL